jgi:hypothetical protein
MDKVFRIAGIAALALASCNEVDVRAAEMTARRTESLTVDNLMLDRRGRSKLPDENRKNAVRDIRLRSHAA